MNVVYLNDDVDYQTICGSTALASTLARSSIPGVRWMVRGGGQIQRGVWLSMWLSFMLITFILCLIYLVFQTDEKYVLRREENTLIPTLPSLLICPGNSPIHKKEVEKNLPVMKVMWDMWNNVTNNQPIYFEGLPWKNRSKTIHDFFSKVMFEGGRLASSGCEDHLKTCDNIMSENVFTDIGICLKFLSGKKTHGLNTFFSILKVHKIFNIIYILGAEKLSQANVIQEQFLLHRNLFNLTVSLNSETSKRLGHPVVSMDYWGQSYLCDSQWSQNEAKVMCRELGFATGAKFYKSKISQKITQSFSLYLGKFYSSGKS